MACVPATWEHQEASDPNLWVSVCSGLGLFVAIANAGLVGEDKAHLIMSSPDGVTWTQRNTTDPFEPNEWQCICFSERIDRFVGVAENGGSGRTIYSDDGISWTYPTDSDTTGSAWNGVCDGPSGFCAVGVFNSGRDTIFSTDGIAWGQDDSGIQHGTKWNSVACSSGGRYVAVGENSSGSTILVRYSDDLANWTGASTGVPSNNWQSVCWSEDFGLFIAVSSNGTGNRIMTSPDGATWTARSTTGFDKTWRGVMAAEGYVMVVGSSDTAILLQSTNGTTYSTVTSAGTNDWRSITHLEDVGFVAVSANGTPTSLERVMLAICNPDVTLALTGVSATSALGSLAPANAEALSGVAATGAVGNLSAGQFITGVSATAALGNLTASRTLALTGVAATGSPGNLSVQSGSIALTGVGGTGSPGDLGVTHVNALGGLAAAGGAGNLGVEVNNDVTVALTSVSALGILGQIVAEGGNFPLPPFSYQLLMDGPRYAVIRVAAEINVELVISLLVDPQDLSSIIPDWPTDVKASRLAIDRILYSTPTNLEIDLWWAGPVPKLAFTLNGTEDHDFSAKGGLQNNAAGSAGQILISTRGLSGNQSFSLTLKVVKQGDLG